MLRRRTQACFRKARTTTKTHGIYADRICAFCCRGEYIALQSAIYGLKYDGCTVGRIIIISFVCLVIRSGKSTFLHILGGLDKPTSGSILVKGEDICKLSDEKRSVFRRRQMGFVFQQYNLLDEYNVRNNICMPLKLDNKKVDEKFYNEIISTLGLEEKTKKYPSELSGGEQQRVAIARSVIAKPQLIIADEPTGNLDKKTGEETIALLLKCAKKFGQTLIIATHDLELARKADMIVRIEDGCVI